MYTRQKILFESVGFLLTQLFPLQYQKIFLFYEVTFIVAFNFWVNQELFRKILSCTYILEDAVYVHYKSFSD